VAGFNGGHSSVLNARVTGFTRTPMFGKTAQRSWEAFAMKLLTTLLTAAVLAAAAPVYADDTSSSSAEPPPPPVALAPGEVAAKDPESILAALSKLGYPGTMDKMQDGRPSISVQISGLKTFVDFYDCADDLTDCYTLLFNVSLDLKGSATLDQANQWNSKEITGRVWLDDKKNPTLDFALSTFDGISEDAFDQNVKLWDKKIGDLKDFFKF